MPRLAARVNKWLKTLGYKPRVIIPVGARRVIAHCPENVTAPFLFVRQIGDQPWNLVCNFRLTWVPSQLRASYLEALRNYETALIPH